MYQKILLQDVFCITINELFHFILGSAVFKIWCAFHSYSSPPFALVTGHVPNARPHVAGGHQLGQKSAERGLTASEDRG